MSIFKKGTLWLMAFLLCFMFALPAVSETPNSRLFVKDWDEPVDVALNPTADPDLTLDKISAACLDENNNMIVAWIEDRGRGDVGGTDEVYIQKLSASDGERQFGNDGRLILEYEGSQYEAIDMVCIGNFAYVVGRTGDGRVYIQKVDLSNGDPLWGTPTTNGKQVGWADDDGKVYLLYNGGDRLFVAYEAGGDTDIDVRASIVNIQTGNVTNVGNVHETDVFTELVAFGLLPAPSNAAWAVVVYSGAGTGWYAKKINADGTMGDQIRIYEKTENADTETAFILPDGQNGALIVASYSPDTTGNNYRISVNGIKADGNFWSEVKLSDSDNLAKDQCQLYAATFMEEGSPDYISLLWSEDGGTNIKLQKFKIGSLGEPKWTAAFDVDTTTLQPNNQALDTDGEGQTVKMADLASGHIAITWKETGEGNAEDIFVLGVGDSEDQTGGVCLFNPEDQCLVFDAGDNETTVENTLLLPTGSGYSMILFDPDTNTPNDQRYRVMRIDVKRRPDVTFIGDPEIDPDELVANEDNDITITDQIENQGQVPAEDIVIRYYLTSTNNPNTFLTTAQKLEIGSRTVASLGIGEEEPSTQDTQVTITKDQISTAFSWNPEHLYIAAYANEDNIEEEGDVYDDNNIKFVQIPDNNITAPDLEPSGITCPGNATAGDTIKLTNLQINNMNATGTGQAVDDAPVYFYLSQYDGTNLAALKSHHTTRLLATTTVDAAVNTNDINIPDVEVTIPSVSSGEWYIYIVPDAENVVAEWDATNHDGEANNVDNGANGRCKITITGIPDYLIDQLTVTPETADVGEQVTVSYVARNQGEGENASSTTIKFYFSRDEVLDEEEDTLLGSDAIPRLDDNDSYANSILLGEIPAVASGTYYIIAYIEPIPGEPDENNQRTVELDVRAGDMVVTPDTFCLVLGEVGTADITGGAAPYTAQSSNTDVATVAVTESTLSITAVGTGSADITVSDSLGQKYLVSVEVNEALTLSENEVNLSIGGTADVDISGGCPDYSAESSNEAVATCTVSDSTLTITGIAEGDATITVSDSAGHTASLTAHVYPGVVVNPDSVNVVKGGTFDCTVSGGLPPYSAVSDNPSIATGDVTDSTLTIVGVEVIDEEPSSTAITVSDSLGQEFDVAVNVYAGIVVNPDELNIYVGDSATATISSAFVRGLAPYSVSCEDTSIATASVDGDVLTVTGVGAGSTICTVSDQLNSTFDVKVNVSEYVDLECSALILNPDEVEVGGSFTASYGVSNVGTLSSPVTKVAFYLSEDETLDDGDEKLAEDLVPSLNPGEGYVDDVTLTIPEGTQADGHYILAMVDPDNEITERLEDNNLCSAPVTVIGEPPIARINAFYSPDTHLLSLSLSLDPGDYAGTNADWWLAAFTPFGTYYYDGTKWVAEETTGYQGALFALNNYPITTFITLPAGTYTFCFAVDLTMDGVLTSPYYYACDSVTVR